MAKPKTLRQQATAIRRAGMFFDSHLRADFITDMEAHAKAHPEEAEWVTDTLIEFDKYFTFLGLPPRVKNENK